MANTGGFKYDVAFSFLERDEALARELAGLLNLSTFVYSQQQLEVAGKDGIDAFTSVFPRHARIVAILYRSGWGKNEVDPRRRGGNQVTLLRRRSGIHHSY